VVVFLNIPPSRLADSALPLNRGGDLDKQKPPPFPARVLGGVDYTHTGPVLLHSPTKFAIVAGIVKIPTGHASVGQNVIKNHIQPHTPRAAQICANQLSFFS